MPHVAKRNLKKFAWQIKRSLCNCSKHFLFIPFGSFFCFYILSFPTISCGTQQVYLLPRISFVSLSFGSNDGLGISEGAHGGSTEILSALGIAPSFVAAKVGCAIFFAKR